MSSDYTGGLFQHVPFQGMLWIREVIRTGLYQPQIQAMFVILGISVFGLCYPIARLILLATYRKLTHAKHNLQRTETLTGDSAELPLDPPSDGRSAKLVEENAVSIVLAMTTTHPRLSNTFSEDEHTLMEDGKEYLHGGQMIGSLPNTQPKAFKPPRSHPNTIVDRGYKRRIPILYVVSVLFAACFTAHLVSLIMAIRNEQNISETLDQIPILAHSLSVSVGQFGNFAIDVAFNLTERHITSDTDQANKGSHLRPLVKGVQDLAAEALACLIQQCHAENLTQPLLWSSNAFDRKGHLGNALLTDFDLIIADLVAEALACLTQQCHAENSTQTLLWSSNASDTKGSLATALLTDFDLIIRRLINLNNAALTMTDDFIHNVTRDWYSFQKALLALTSTNVELSVYYNRSQNSRLGYPLFTQTRTVICDYLTVEHLNEFSDCNDVTQFLDRMFDFVENVQFMLPQKRLGTAVQFTTIPRALGIEQLVAKLLPAATDIPGRGVLFLLNTFLRPEIERLRAQMTGIFLSLPTDEMLVQMARCKRLFTSFFVVLFAFLVTSSVLLAILFFIALLQKFQKRPKQRKTEPDLLKKAVVINSLGIGTVNRSKFWNHCTHSLIPLFVCLIVSFCMLAAVIGAALSFVSGLVHSEFCVYLFEGPAQTKADLVLTERLSAFSRTIQPVNDIISIEHLNPRFPYPTLRTLDSEYRHGQTPLLQRLHMTPLLNFTALLHSQWFTTKLHQLWESDVRQKLLATDFTVHIPKISLISIFNQAKESMNLENSFDALEVGTVQDYLNEPGPFYFHTLARVLDKIGTERAVKLSQSYAMLGQAQAAYARKYHVVNHTLSIIEANKEIIAPLALLIKNVSIALDHLNAMQSMQIVTMLDQIITVGWPRILPKIDEHMIPFLEGLLNDLIPFPGLRTIYHQALSPLCPDPVHLRKTSQVAVTSINPELGQLGFSLFVSSILLVIGILFYWYLWCD
ncbi:hypothetical protein T265_00730 [Opisthorchis viverrini]|uniref:Prominin n=1 Tax=Opisthorchis viverrini TaxID=6198 RepID=A0A075A229_OPIVI|nr:hypothetical protein T265_00730 [Opisthorchis viverrini]KER33421.1 hypothetical protein T265_00730 [Opisthorchis viverrini]